MQTEASHSADAIWLRTSGARAIPFVHLLNHVPREAYSGHDVRHTRR
jgi:hypothetical protein